ncbi:hypothetical protein JCM8547_004940 [Rhodosporidiobolus lusitaniae]
MMLAAAKAGFNMVQTGGLGEKPRSSVSALIDILCLEKYEEDDYEGITELVESINLQPTTGPTEASRAIRKKLKYSDVHGQLRALTIIKALVENGGGRFQKTFADERLVDRIKLMAGDPHTDPRVKKKLMNVLGSWYIQFKDDPSMRLVAGLYKSCGGGKQASRSAATEAYEAQQARYEREAAQRLERKEAERRAREAEKERVLQEKLDKAKRKEQERARASGNKTKRPPFNFEAEKPRMMASVGTGTQSAQALIMALQRVNREKESVRTNAKVQEALEKAKNDRKPIIRYIQLVTNSEKDLDGEYIGTLLATNEQIINAVQLYDRMSKPVELDSDDEAIEEAKRLATEQGLTVPPSATPHDNNNNDDTQSIRSRLSAFDMQDREVDKLQRTQRRRLERHLSSRGQVPTMAGMHPDLQDLAFGSTASSSGSSSLPPPIDPRSPDDTYRHGSLSDYSDYSSETDEYSSDSSSIRASTAGPSGTSSTPARSYAQYVREEDERTGKGKGLLEPDDPFADPFADGNEEVGDYEVMQPGRGDRKGEWAEV